MTSKNVVIDVNEMSSSDVTFLLFSSLQIDVRRRPENLRLLFLFLHHHSQRSSRQSRAESRVE